MHIDTIDKITSSEEICKDYDLIVLAQMVHSEQICKVNEMQREKNKGFIFAQTFGLSGSIFVDFGRNYILKDNRPDREYAFIQNISTHSLINHRPDEGRRAIAQLHYDNSHNIEEGMYAVFEGVVGMEEINQSEPVRVLEATQKSIVVDLDISEFGDYQDKGIIEWFFKESERNFASYKDSLSETSALHNAYAPDWSRVKNLHLGYWGIQRYFDEHLKLPSISDKDTDEILSIIKEFNSSIKLINEEELNKDITKNMSRFWETSLPFMSSYFSGIVAQEIIKFNATRTPIFQWLHLDFFDLLPTQPVDRQFEWGKYEGQIRVFGSEVHRKLTELKVFLTGAGPIANQLVKMLAIMGVGSKNSGWIIVNDWSEVNEEDINSHVLFTEEEVGIPKVKALSAAIKKLNPDYSEDLGGSHFKTLQEELTNDEAFNEDLLEGVDVVINGSWSLNERKMIDIKWVFYSIPFLDWGVKETLAHCQVILPYFTESYNCSSDPVPTSIPFGDHRNFPRTYEMAVIWGKFLFDEHFKISIEKLKSYMRDSKNFLEKERCQTHFFSLVNTLKIIKEMLKLKVEDTPDKLIQKACDVFHKMFYIDSKNTLYFYPEDKVVNSLGK
jgi:ubiquitin-activating enzyme E1